MSIGLTRGHKNRPVKKDHVFLKRLYVLKKKHCVQGHIQEVQKVSQSLFPQIKTNVFLLNYFLLFFHINAIIFQKHILSSNSKEHTSISETSLHFCAVAEIKLQERIQVEKKLNSENSTLPVCSLLTSASLKQLDKCKGLTTLANSVSQRQYHVSTTMHL